MASYGSSDYIAAISQLAQTTLRSLIGRMEMIAPSRSVMISTAAW